MKIDDNGLWSITTALQMGESSAPQIYFVLVGPPLNAVDPVALKQGYSGLVTLVMEAAKVNADQTLLRYACHYVLTGLFFTHINDPPIVTIGSSCVVFVLLVALVTSYSNKRCSSLIKIGLCVLYSYVQHFSPIHLLFSSLYLCHELY